MKEHIPAPVLKYADRTRKLYWNIAKPTRYGVKGLIFHPTDPESILLIRQSYGNTNRLNLPGGGYKPKKETPISAVKREVLEEVGIELTEATVIHQTISELEGKKDYLSFIGARALTDTFTLSEEVSEAIWTAIDLSEIPDGYEVSGFITDALIAYSQAT